MVISILKTILKIFYLPCYVDDHAIDLVKEHLKCPFCLSKKIYETQEALITVCLDTGEIVSKKFDSDMQRYECECGKTWGDF